VEAGREVMWRGWRGGGILPRGQNLKPENKCPGRKVPIQRRDVYQRGVAVKDRLQLGYDF
jgi:hypothetical protein